MFALSTQLKGMKPRIEAFKIYEFSPGDIEFYIQKMVFSEKVNEVERKLVITQGESERIQILQA